MRYLPKSTLRAAGVLTAAAALARAANGHGVVRTPAVIRARRCSVIHTVGGQLASRNCL